MDKDEAHDNLHGLQIECEECGGEAEVINAVYPNSYECICKKCKHKFIWIESEEKR